MRHNIMVLVAAAPVIDGTGSPRRRVRPIQPSGMEMDSAIPLISVSALPDRARALYDLYEDIRHGLAVPLRSQFDAFSLRRWMGDIAIAEPRDNCCDLYMRLWGVNCVDYFGCDITHRLLSDYIPADLLGKVMHGYRLSHEQSAVVFSQIPSGACQFGRSVDLERTIFPCSRDGRTVAQFITLVCARRFMAVDPFRSSSPAGSPTTAGAAADHTPGEQPTPHYIDYLVVAP